MLFFWKSKSRSLTLLMKVYAMPKELKLHSKILLLIGTAAAMLPCFSAQAQNFFCSGSIQDCINDAAAAGGGNVILEERTYRITQTIIPRSNVNLIGQGSGSVITWASSVADTINAPLIGDDGTTALINVGFSNFRLLGTVDITDPNDRDREDHMGIYIDGPGQPSDVSSLRHHNIAIANLEISQFGGNGIHIKGSNNVTLLDLDMYDNGWFPVDLFHNLYLLRVRNASMIQTKPEAGFRDSPSGHGLRMGTLENVYFEGLVIEGNADHGIHMNNVVNMRGYDISSRNNGQSPMGGYGDIRCYGACDVDLDLSNPRSPFYFPDFLLSSAPAPSQFIDLNGDFRDGLSGWDVADGRIDLSSRGHDDGISARLRSSDARLERRVDVLPNTNYRLRGRIETNGRFGYELGGSRRSSTAAGAARNFKRRTFEFNTGNNDRITIFCEYRTRTGRFDNITLENLDGTER